MTIKENELSVYLILPRVNIIITLGFSNVVCLEPTFLPCECSYRSLFGGSGWGIPAGSRPTIKKFAPAATRALACH